MLGSLANFRDVGDGRTIRSGRLFRSDALDRLTAAEAAHLHYVLGIRTILDLRAPGESADAGKPAPAAPPIAPVRITAPLTTSGPPGASFGAPGTSSGAPGASSGPPTTSFVPSGVRGTSVGSPLVADYVGRLDHDPVLPRAVEVVAASAHRPIVVHCAAGKDRTGIVIALVLALADVPREFIVRDYLATAPNLPVLLARTTQTLPAAWYECTREPIEALLDALDQYHGGAATWARSAGIPPLAVSALRIALRPDLR